MTVQEAGRNSGLFNIGMVVWTLGLVFFGTHFRVRAVDEQFAAPTMDWYILAQLTTSIASAVIGLILLSTGRWRWCLGSIAVLAYVAAAGMSTIWAVESKTVLGYWVLLVGFSMLTVGLVKNAHSIERLQFIEKVWLITITILLFKDAITSLFFLRSMYYSEEVFRIGANVTHPSTMSLLAAIALFLSFRQGNSSSVVWWLIRLSYIVIIILARTRISMIAVVIGCVAWVWFRSGSQQEKGYYLRAIMITGSFSMLFALSLAILLELPVIQQAVEAFNRGGDAGDLMSVTGRTEIWSVVIRRIFDDPVSVLFGHGYGISRLVLAEDLDPHVHAAAHTHNTVLEFILNMGALGGITCVLFYAAALRWYFNYYASQSLSPGNHPGNQLGKELGKHANISEFSLHAIVVVTVLLTCSFTEALFAQKIDPAQLVFMFYIVALDQLKVVTDTTTSDN